MRHAATFALLALMLAAEGSCTTRDWWCEAGQDGKCFAKPEFCSGTCAPQETAYCFTVGQPTHAGNFTVPADRFCYTTSEICFKSQKHKTDVSSSCSPDEP